jgi:hypothetical protein
MLSTDDWLVPTSTKCILYSMIFSETSHNRFCLDSTFKLLALGENAHVRNPSEILVYNLVLLTWVTVTEYPLSLLMDT